MGGANGTNLLPLFSTATKNSFFFGSQKTISGVSKQIEKTLLLQFETSKGLWHIKANICHSSNAISHENYHITIFICHYTLHYIDLGRGFWEKGYVFFTLLKRGIQLFPHPLPTEYCIRYFVIQYKTFRIPITVYGILHLSSHVKIWWQSEIFFR